MDWNLKVNNNWSGGQKKNLQRMLNTFGFTDGTGNALKEDGIIGPKTTSAIGKLNQYQSEARTPSSQTRELQKQLNDFGFKDAAGKSLKEDGIYGPKTDAASNDFENNFLDGVTGGKNTAKTVQKNIYPSLPQITQKDVESVITPKAATVKDPMASQKNADGTWKQVAAPGAWSGSGGTSAKEQEHLENARIAQAIMAQIKAGRAQGGYQETGGAQSQAYQGNVPGSTYDKTQKGTYTNWTETGGAQGQATTAPSTGNEGFDMLLGKGKYTGVYNNSNRPSDTIILEKILESANLPKSANVVNNNAGYEKNSESLGGINTLSASGTSTAQNNQKNADGTWKQVAAPGAWSGSGGTSANEQALLEKAKAAQDMTRRSNEGRTQAGYQETGSAQEQEAGGLGAQGSVGGPVLNTGYGLKGGTTLFGSTGIEDITNPRAANVPSYSPFQDPILRPDVESSLADDFQKQYNEATQKTQYEEARKKRAQIAIDELHERRRQNELLKDKQTIIERDARDLSDPNNKDTVMAVQKAIGMAEDGIWGRDMLARLEVFLSEKGDQVDGSLVLSDKNLDSLFGTGTGIAQEAQNNGFADANTGNGKGLPFQTNTDTVTAEMESLKLKARSFGGIDLSDPKNSDVLKMVERAIGLPEDGEWTLTVMNRLQDALMSEFDQLDTNTLRLSEKNLETLGAMYADDHTDAEAATYFVLDDKNIARMTELANKDTLSESEITEAFDAAKNIELFLDYNHDQLKSVLLDYENNKEAIDLYIKLFRLHYNLSLKSDSWQAFSMGAVSELPFVESGINWVNNSNLEKVKEKAEAGDELAQAFLNDHGIQTGNKFEVAKTAFHDQYLAGEITSIVGQIIISVLLTGGALTELNVASKLASAGIPPRLVPTFVRTIKSAVTQTYLAVQEASKPGYDMNYFWDNLAKKYVNVQAEAVAGLFINAAGIIGNGPFAQLIGEIITKNLGNAYDSSTDGEEKSDDEKAKNLSREAGSSFAKQFAKQFE